MSSDHRSELKEGTKFDDGKLRYDLLPAGPLAALVSVYTYGARKYADHNWRKGISFSRIFAACMRHLWAYWGGQDRDQESGLPHLAHAAFGIFSLLEYGNTHPEFDDRYINEPPKKLFTKSDLTDLYGFCGDTNCRVCGGSPKSDSPKS